MLHDKAAAYQCHNKAESSRPAAAPAFDWYIVQANVANKRIDRFTFVSPTMLQHNSVRAAYTGTFDPITNGHADVIRRAASLFDELIVAVATSSEKRSIFNHAERVEIAGEVLADVDNVRVMPVTDLIVDFARANDVRVLVRGVRGVGDYEYEKQMAMMNRHLAPEVDTILLAPSAEYAHISSTLVREIAFLDGCLAGLVPEPVAARLQAATER